MPLSNENISAPPAPIDELQRILEDAGPDVKKLFSTALNIFAGPFASTQAYKDKKDSLERVLRGN